MPCFLRPRIGERATAAAAKAASYRLSTDSLIALDFGAAALTRMPSSAHAIARATVSCCTAALLGSSGCGKLHA